MVMMMRKKKILLEWCAGPQDSPHCAYIARQEHTEGTEYVSTTFIVPKNCLKATTRVAEIVASRMGGSRDRERKWEDNFYRQGLNRVLVPKILFYRI